MGTTLDKAYQKEILTNYARAVLNEDTNFVGQRIAPFLKVNKDAGQIFDYGRQGLKVVEAGRAIGARFKHLDFTTTLSDQRLLRDHGFTSFILKEEIENAETPIQARQAKLKLMMQIMMLNYETSVAGVITTANVPLNTTLVGTAQWNDYLNSNPITNIENAKEVVRKRSGKKANSIFMSRPVLSILKRHPQILVLFRNVTVVTDAMLETMVLRDIFGFENVIIGEAQYENKNLQQVSTETDDLVDIWGKKVLVFHSVAQPNMYDTTFMRTFAKRDGLVAGSFSPSEEQRFAQKIESGLIVENKYDLSFIDNQAGFLIENAIA